MALFILTRLVLIKYSRVFVERPLQGTSLQLTTVSFDMLFIGMIGKIKKNFWIE